MVMSLTGEHFTVYTHMRTLSCTSQSSWSIFTYQLQLSKAGRGEPSYETLCCINVCYEERVSRAPDEIFQDFTLTLLS